MPRSGIGLNELLGGVPANSIPIGVCSYVELPADSALTGLVLVMVLRRKWVVLVGCNFSLATKATVNARDGDVIARVINGGPPSLVSVALNQYRTVDMPRHFSLLVEK